MELLRQELGERPAAERALRALGEAVGLSRSTIRRRLRSAPVTIEQKDLQRRAQIQAIALEMRSYGYRPIAKELRRASPTASPNTRIVELADRVLGRGGRMIRAIETIGRGIEAFEAHPFRLELE